MRQFLNFVFRYRVNNVQKRVFRQCDNSIGQYLPFLGIEYDLDFRSHGLFRIGFNDLADSVGIQPHKAVNRKSRKYAQQRFQMLALKPVFAGIDDLFDRRKMGQFFSLGPRMDKGLIHIQQPDDLGVLMNLVSPHRPRVP